MIGLQRLSQHVASRTRSCAGLYALVCATAVLAGVFRSAISLVVLVVEGTRSVNFLFGIILAVVVANLTAGLFDHDGVYESEIEHDHSVAFLHAEAPPVLATITISEVMAHNPDCVAPVTPLRAVLRLLRDTDHHGFPIVAQLDKSGFTVVNGSSDGGAGKGPGAEGPGELVGLALRSQLLVLLEEMCEPPARASTFASLTGHCLRLSLLHGDFTSTYTRYS